MKRRYGAFVFAIAAATLLLAGSVAAASIKGRLTRLEMNSSTLHRKTAVFVYLPPGYDQSRERLPVVYLLHGNPGKSSDWFARGHIEETTDKLIVSGKIHPLIMVAADCFGRGGSHSHDAFLNSIDGKLLAEDFVAHELPAWVDGKYRTIQSANARALSGLSSGGYGAVNVGGKHTEVFHIMVSHSGFFDPKVEAPYVTRMLGPQGPLWDANNPEIQVKNWRDPKSVHVYLDIGEDDELLPESCDLDKALGDCGIDHVFSVVKGVHEWSLWRKQFAVSITWVDRWFHP